MKLPISYLNLTTQKQTKHTGTENTSLKEKSNIFAKLESSLIMASLLTYHWILKTEICLFVLLILI